MNLIPNGSNTIKHFVGQSTHEMLSGVHPHVCISGRPVDGATHLIADLELMVVRNGVRYIASPTNFGNMHVAVGSGAHPGIPMLTTTKRIEEGAVENDGVALNRRNSCVKLPCIGGIDALKVEFDRHVCGTVRVLMRLTIEEVVHETTGFASRSANCFFNSRKVIMRPLTSSQSRSWMDLRLLKNRSSGASWKKGCEWWQRSRL